MDTESDNKPEENAEEASQAPSTPAASGTTMSEAKVAPKKKSKKAPVRAKEDLSVLDVAVSVLLLVLLGFLVANSYLAYLGKSYNERICQRSIGLAAKAAEAGEDTQHVLLAAYDSYKDCAPSGFFIQHPEFTSFKDEISKDLRVVTISTATQVRIPAAFLVLNEKALDQDGQVIRSITFKETYQYRLSNPKHLEGKLIKGKDGKMIRLPGVAKPADTPAPPAKPASNK